MTQHKDSFATASVLQTDRGDITFYSLQKLDAHGIADLSRLPFSIKILIENLLRNEDGDMVQAENIARLAAWQPAVPEAVEVPFMPARILLQDFTGVPSVVDMAALRKAAARLYGDPMRINPRIPAELVIDHSIQVDAFGSRQSFAINDERDYRRNAERYAFLRWGQKSFDNFRVVPPATGICHQVNLEYLARVIYTADRGGDTLAFPDTLVGLDSHTTMINGIGVMGWGVGGIEAEAVMLGRPYYLLTPQVVGVRLSGELPPQVTATDLVLTITQMLRESGVVGKFVEFFGPGLDVLSVEDRATIANMSPEYGATMGFFPVDAKTLAYLRLTGRPQHLVDLVEIYCKAQGLFRTDTTPDPMFSQTIELDMGDVHPCMAGPKRPQDRILLPAMKPAFREAVSGAAKTAGAPVELGEARFTLRHGAVVIAAITSCTNTSNPAVLIAAGLLAKKACARGLTAKPWVKTSLAPGSKVVMRYLQAAGLMPYFERLNFFHVAYGCTTCIGNSGPLPDPIAAAVRDHGLYVAAVLSGNRNFEGRINPLTRLNYLASPPLVVAHALCGRVGMDFDREPLGNDPDGQPVFLRDIWPADEEVADVVRSFVRPEMFQREYATVFQGSARWQALPVPEGALYDWQADSTYIKEPPFFEAVTAQVPVLEDIIGARVLALLGDSITTDHISPAGAIAADSPAGAYLISQGVNPVDFNSFGSRRGNHEVMVRGTFANIRLQNKLIPGVDGGWTRLLPEGEKMSIYDAAVKYAERRIPLIVMAGQEYGTGSSRDWAAKGTALLGVKAVITRSYERIHRSNLVCMGVLPLQFLPGESAAALGLDGTETYDIRGIADDMAPNKVLAVSARRNDGGLVNFRVRARIDSPVELRYYRHGGILNDVLRNIG